MARTALTVQQITRSALTPTYTAANASGGNSIPNNDGQILLIVKTVGTGCVVTVDTPGTVDGNAIANKTYTLGTNAERHIGPFPPNVYNQADGSVYLDFDSVTSVTLSAERLT
jgi:hypothetical protein